MLTNISSKEIEESFSYEITFCGVTLTRLMQYLTGCTKQTTNVVGINFTTFTSSLKGE